MHAHDYGHAHEARRGRRRAGARPKGEAEGLIVCPCGAQATTREAGRDRCGPCTDRRLADVAAQARARAKADEADKATAHVGSLLSIGLVWLVAAVAWAVS